MQNLHQLKHALSLSHDEEMSVTFSTFRDDMSARLVSFVLIFFLSIRDDYNQLELMFSFKTHGTAVPDHLQELYKKADRFAAMELTAQHEYDYLYKKCVKKAIYL